MVEVGLVAVLRARISAADDEPTAAEDEPSARYVAGGGLGARYMEVARHVECVWVRVVGDTTPGRLLGGGGG